jgi:hypothetical protein
VTQAPLHDDTVAIVRTPGVDPVAERAGVAIVRCQRCRRRIAQLLYTGGALVPVTRLRQHPEGGPGEVFGSGPDGAPLLSRITFGCPSRRCGFSRTAKQETLLAAWRRASNVGRRELVAGDDF